MTSGQGNNVFGAQAAAKQKPAKNTANATRPTSATGTKVDHTRLAQINDLEVSARLKAENVQASPLTDDAEFLRRAYLDLIGVIPPVDKVKEFLDDKDANKRSKLIDELLAHSRYGNFMAETWATPMVPRESVNRRLLEKPLQEWLASQFNANTPWDKFVYDLVTAAGPQDKNGAVTYFISNPTPDKITDSVTRMFLGVQLQCAQCHNHPFTDWKQKEYWAMAAFFMNVRTNANPQQAAKKGITIEVSEGPAAKGKKKKGLPESAMFVPAKFLQGDQPKMNNADPARPVLAKWMTDGKNPFFARAMVNKMWAHFFGRGIVNPIDDMHEGNTPSHPELLAALSEQFTANGFDLKYLIRAIMNSQAYQRTSRPHGGNDADTELFSHQAVRVMMPEQLFDSITTVIGQAGVGPKKAPAAGKKGPVTPRDAFIAFFRIEDADPLEYQAGIPQALRLMNSAQINGKLPAVDQALKAGATPQVIEHLYMATLSRRPTSQELDRLNKYVGAQRVVRDGYGDILWALVNSSEFTSNH